MAARVVKGLKSGGNLPRILDFHGYVGHFGPMENGDAYELPWQLSLRSDSLFF